MNSTQTAQGPARRRGPDPHVEASKAEVSVLFFRDVATCMNGHPPTDAEVERGAKRLSKGIPPFWDWRTRKYL